MAQKPIAAQKVEKQYLDTDSENIWTNPFFYMDMEK